MELQPKISSLLTKVLILLVVILVGVLIALGILLYISDNNKGIEYCTSESCIKSAAKVISSIDNTIDPCDDFYQYACGGWIKENALPDRVVWNIFRTLNEQNELILKKALEKPVLETKSKAEQKAKMFYMSCMDPNNTIETLGARPLLNLLEDVGGWNISGGSFDIKGFDLQKTLQALKINYSSDALFLFDVNYDYRNISNFVFRTDEGGLVLPTTIYRNPVSYKKIIIAYLDYMTQVGVLLGGEYNSTRKQMIAVIEFEMEIAGITISDKDKKNNIMSIAQLQEIAPFISWIEFFSNAAQVAGKQITDHENVNSYSIQYLLYLSSIINEKMKTDNGKNAINNYLLWQTIQKLCPYLSKEFRNAVNTLKKALSGTEGTDKSWTKCLSTTETTFDIVMGRMYVDENFQGDSKPKAVEMIKEIKTAFAENLNGLAWMDEETISLAKDKADAISFMIGYPDYILDNVKLDQEFMYLEIDESQHFENVLRCYKEQLRKNVAQIGTTMDWKTTWLMSPQTVNAYYMRRTNQMVFPAGILQSPFYDKSQSQSLNFGGIGMVMGHELTHGFDNTGRKYDKYGELHQWWNNRTIQKFVNRTQCIANQYSNYAINGLHLNGNKTLGEDIADNGGIKEAFRAYIDWTNTNGEELPLPGLNLNHKQLFFLGFAQNWCSVVTDDAYYQLQILYNVHSIPNFRVNGPLSNFPEFAKQFSCPIGSKMNPASKCEVW